MKHWPLFCASLLLTAILLLQACKKDPLPLFGSLVDTWNLVHAEEVVSGDAYLPTFNRLTISRSLQYELLQGNSNISEGSLGVASTDSIQLIFFSPRFGAPILFEANAKVIEFPVGDTLLLEDTEGFRYRYTFIRE
jgi:hypothetical protein